MYLVLALTFLVMRVKISSQVGNISEEISIWWDKKCFLALNSTHFFVSDGRNNRVYLLNDDDEVEVAKEFKFNGSANRCGLAHHPKYGTT